ncbi:MAG: HesB/IscA family protein [Gammaproteobacteria bacterium]
MINSWQPEQAVTLSESAYQHIQKILDKHQMQMIRFGVKKSGCSGLAYIIEPIEQADNTDIVIQFKSVKIAIDSKSLPIVNGTIIDYVREGLNSHFKYHNPQEKGSCGCGESFNI